MPELIDRATVLKYLTPRIKAETPYGEGYNRALEDAAGLVTLMPTIEQDELTEKIRQAILNAKGNNVEFRAVRHGRWECGGFCSECGLDNEERKTTFCPNCGAKMDGGADNG